MRKRWRTKRRTKDLDEVSFRQVAIIWSTHIRSKGYLGKNCFPQIDVDIKPENAEKLLNQELDLDKPGEAQHYCLHCA